MNGVAVTKPGYLAKDDDTILLTTTEQYVSRAGLKLASVARALALDFNGKTVLDVGSSTGGFTDYALRHGAKKVIAVEVGTDQLHPSLHGHPQITPTRRHPVAVVFRRNIESADERRFLVAHQDFAMIPVAHPAKLERVEPPEFSARFGQRLPEAVRQSKQGHRHPRR